MNRYLFIFFIFLILGCSSSDNNITEVGNPTTVGTTNGTTTALTNSIVSLVDVVTTPTALTKNTGEGYECSFDEETSIETCSCSGGGSTSYVFNDAFEESGTIFTFDSSFEVTFDNCVFSSCDETITFNGSMSGAISGSFDTSTEEGDIVAIQQTQTECSGMTANEVDLGFNMTMTYDGSSEDFSGTFCYDNETISFSSLEELETLLDPDNSCEDSFGHEDSFEDDGSEECEACIHDCEATGLDETTCFESCEEEGHCV